MNTRSIYKVEQLIIKDLCFVVLTKAVKRISMKIDKHGVAVITKPLSSSLNDVIPFAKENYQWAENAKRRMEDYLAKYEHKPYSPEERENFMQAIKQRFPFWEEQMGLRASQVTIKLMSSRWGSCNHRTRSISINLRLARKPLECLDYVIIHELAHIAHNNHSDNFWNLVSKYCPDWKSIRQSLRDQ